MLLRMLYVFLTMGGVSHIDEAKKDLLKDVHMLVIFDIKEGCVFPM